MFREEIESKPTPKIVRYTFNTSDLQNVTVCAHCLRASLSSNNCVRFARAVSDSIALEVLEYATELVLPSGNTVVGRLQDYTMPAGGDWFVEFVKLFGESMYYKDESCFPIGTGVAVTYLEGDALCTRCAAVALHRKAVK